MLDIQLFYKVFKIIDTCPTCDQLEVLEGVKCIYFDSNYILTRAKSCEKVVWMTLVLFKQFQHFNEGV